MAKEKTGFKISKNSYDVVIPDGFNFKDYKPLKKKNFKTDELYYRHRVKEMEFKMEAFVVKADEAKKLGSSSDRRKKKQIIKLQAKIIELKRLLTDQGIDVEALLRTETGPLKE